MEKHKTKRSEIIMHLDKSLTVQNAVTLKEQFKNAIAKGDLIIIDHSGIEEFDITYLQMLISLDRYANELGKTIKFTGSHPDSFRALIQNAGLGLDHWKCEENHSINEKSGSADE